jgi:hypothetical protein
MGWRRGAFLLMGLFGIVSCLLCFLIVLDVCILVHDSIRRCHIVHRLLDLCIRKCKFEYTVG